MIKRNELSNHEKTWRNLKCILLRERSQSEKATYYVIPFVGHSGKGKAIDAIKKISSCRCSWGERQKGEAQERFRL